MRYTGIVLFCGHTMPSAPFSWTFDWLTQPVGLFNKLESGWVLRGRPHGTPDTGWIVAHDVFHHRPEDRGTYADEATTFGAETWFEEESETPEAISDALAASWVGVCMLVLENGSRGAKGLVLKTPIEEAALAHPLAYLWRQSYVEAIRESEAVFKHAGDDETWALLKSPDQVNRAISVAWRGYENAQQRWPDRPQAIAWFKELSALASEAEVGATIEVHWDGETLRMARQDAIAPTTRRAPGPRR